jgi:hypothetical protein
LNTDFWKKNFPDDLGENVFKTVNYRLTPKGKAVAFNLAEISKILESAERSPVPVLRPKMAPYEEFAFTAKIMEAIEVALEGYGVNFVSDVKGILESDYKLRWQDVSGKPNLLEVALVEFFGASGASNVLAMICSNIRSRFGLDKREPDDLQHLLSEARETFKKLHKDPVVESGASITRDKKSLRLR